MRDLLNNQRQSLEILSSQLGEIRDKLLTKDEKTVINMVIEGKSDKQISQVLQVTVSAINQKRMAIYKLILGLNWWKQNRDTILQTLDKELGGVAAVMFNMVATRRKQNEIAKQMGMSIWKVNKSMGIILEVLSRNPEFRTYMENMHLGYHLSWRVKKEKKEKKEVNATPAPGSEQVDATPAQATDPVPPAPEPVQSQVPPVPAQTQQQTCWPAGGGYAPQGVPVQQQTLDPVPDQTQTASTVEEGAKSNEEDNPPVL